MQQAAIPTFPGLSSTRLLDRRFLAPNFRNAAEFTPPGRSAISYENSPFFARGCNESEAIRLHCFIAAFQPAQARSAQPFRGQRRRTGSLARVQCRLSRGRSQIHAVSHPAGQAGAGIRLRSWRLARRAGALLRRRHRFQRKHHCKGQCTASRYAFCVRRRGGVGYARLDRGAVRLHLLADTIGMFEDIDGTLRLVHHLCAPSTRIVISYYSHLWEPVLKLAEALRLRAKQPKSTISRPPTF